MKDAVTGEYWMDLPVAGGNVKSVICNLRRYHRWQYKVSAKPPSSFWFEYPAGQKHLMELTASVSHWRECRTCGRMEAKWEPWWSRDGAE